MQQKQHTQLNCLSPHHKFGIATIPYLFILTLDIILRAISGFIAKYLFFTVE
jgi:hypothetical protein